MDVCRHFFLVAFVPLFVGGQRNIQSSKHPKPIRYIKLLIICDKCASFKTVDMAQKTSLVMFLLFFIALPKVQLCNELTIALWWPFS